MILNELEAIYGFFGEEQKKWISEYLEYLTEEEKSNFINLIKKEHPIKRGIPDIQVLQKVKSRVTGKPINNYYWAVCMDCKTEYDYNLPMCPSCYENGIICRVVSVKKSEFQPPAKVIRYNKAYIGDGTEKICYNCENKNESYCRHFGDSEWTCNDLAHCKCAGCCVKTKKENQKALEVMESQKKTYGKKIGG